MILPFSIAYKFPIIIYKNVNICEIRRGGIVFCSPIKVGLLQIGRHGVGTIDLKKISYDVRNLRNINGYG